MGADLKRKNNNNKTVECKAFSSCQNLEKEQKKKKKIRCSPRGSVVNESMRNHEVEGSITGLAQWLRIRRCHELWCRLQTGPLAREPPYAEGAAQEMAKKRKRKKKEKEQWVLNPSVKSTMEKP